jgi:ATP-binding cassette subfamily B protein
MLKLLKGLRPYSLHIAAVCLLVFGQAISELYLPTLMADIIDVGVVEGNIPYIWNTGGIMLLVTLAGTVCTILAGFLASRTAVGFTRNLRSRVFRRVESFSLDEFDRIGTASMIIRTTNDMNQVQQALFMILRMMLFAPMMAIGGAIMAISKDPPLSMILLVVMPLIAGFVAFVGKKGFPLFKKIQQRVDDINLVLRESLTGVRVIRAFNKEEHELKRFEQANRYLMDVSVTVNRLMAVAMPMIMLIFNLTTIAVVWFGGLRIDSGNMEIGELMAFIQYIMRIMFSLVMMTMMLIMIPRASVSAGRINEILELEPSIRDSEKTGENSRAAPGQIVFDHVSFSYHGAEQPAISDISFSVEPGTVTALIGGTGSGKSTVINLIPRFYDVQSGSIRLGGTDIRELTQNELRSRIGYVSQKSMLFSGTVAENIRFAASDASHEEVVNAARIAQAADFIEDMEHGYETIIAQGGANVSGGQKQRLAIARALAAKRDIYLFDDSFSALDFKTDAALRKALFEKTRNSAVIMVSQRVSTVMKADQIIVMDDGSIVGKGTHEQLLETCPIYREISDSQLSREVTA